VSWQNWGQNFERPVKQPRGPSMMQRHGPSVCLYNTSQSHRSGRRHLSPSARIFHGLFPTMKLESHWQQTRITGTHLAVYLLHPLCFRPASQKGMASRDGQRYEGGGTAMDRLHHVKLVVGN
jgi:hypothetical protein